MTNAAGELSAMMGIDSCPTRGDYGSTERIKQAAWPSAGIDGSC